MTSETLEIINTFIGHIIWPVTLLVLFLVFRKQITRKMDKLNSIDASSTGISLKFEEELDAAIEELVETAEEKPKLVSKSGTTIIEDVKEKKPETPVAMLLALRDEMNQKLVRKSESVGITTSGKSSSQLLDALEVQNEITTAEHKRWNRLLELTHAVDQNITKGQVNKVRLLFNNYSKEL